MEGKGNPSEMNVDGATSHSGGSGRETYFQQKIDTGDKRDIVSIQ
jgi:hypothetical protein